VSLGVVCSFLYRKGHCELDGEVSEDGKEAHQIEESRINMIDLEIGNGITKTVHSEMVSAVEECLAGPSSILTMADLTGTVVRRAFVSFHPVPDDGHPHDSSSCQAVQCQLYVEEEQAHHVPASPIEPSLMGDWIRNPKNPKDSEPYQGFP
jgi:hypothetical protein